MVDDRERYSSETQALLLERYGKPGGRGRALLPVIIALVALPWLLWTAWHHANPALAISPVKYQTIDDRSISLTFDLVRRDPSEAALCTIIALDFDRNVVGEFDLTVAPSSSRIERISTTVPTRVRAVNASAQRCIAISDAPVNQGK